MNNKERLLTLIHERNFVDSWNDSTDGSYQLAYECWENDYLYPLVKDLDKVDKIKEIYEQIDEWESLDEGFKRSVLDLLKKLL